MDYIHALRLLTFFACWYGSQVANGEIVNVYKQEYTIEDYLYATDLLPAMSEFTLCMWFHGYPSSNNRHQEWLVSLAIPGNHNEMLIGFSSAQTLTIYVGSQIYNFAAESAEANDARLLGWHKHCFTWKAGSNFKWYTSRLDNANKMELWKTKDVGSQTIRAGGSLVFLHDQDSQLGGYDLAQITEGKVALVNMWDHELTIEAIQRSQDSDCLVHGNLLSMSDMSIGGNAVFTQEDLPCGGSFVLLPKQHTENYQSSTFNLIPGARLQNHQLMTVTAETVSVCVRKCLMSAECVSLNYIVSNNTCELNSAVASVSLNMDFTKNLDSSFVHYTLQAPSAVN